MADTKGWLPRDWQRAAQAAIENPALQSKLADLEEEASVVHINSPDAEAREAARQRILAMRLIKAELEQWAAELTRP